METEKIGFFKRVKMAIFNLEKYGTFANEKFSKALKYLILLIVIVTVCLAVTSVIKLDKQVGKLTSFIKSEEFPDFKLKDGKLDAKSKLNSYDREYDGKLIIDTTEDLPDETLKEYKKEGKEVSYTVIFLKDKIVYRFDINSDNWYETTYNNATTMFGVSELTKEKLVNDYLNDDVIFQLRVVLFIYAFMTILLMNIVILLEDVLIISIFGWLSSKIARVSVSLTKCFSLGIYSLTLSIILSTIYSIVNSFTGFTIRYFEIMYMIIAYIYMIASIMIMKDGNKTAGEAVTVEGEVLKTDEEKEEDPIKEDKKDKKKKIPEKEDKDKEEIPEDTENKEESKKEKKSKGDK